VATGEEGEIRFDDLVELDETAPPASNAERARQQAAFHAREVRELGEVIAADPAAQDARNRTRDPRQAERTRHRAMELMCREIAEAFDWLGQKHRPSGDLGLGMEHVRAGYDAAPEVDLLRRIAGTQYPLLTTIASARHNGVGLLAETQLSLKHAARGRALADTLTVDDAETLLTFWLDQAAAIGGGATVNLLAVHQAVEWLVHLAAERAKRDHARMLEDDLEATIYLARATLDDAGFAYPGPVDPPPGY
jgi:hypothetical protein